MATKLSSSTCTADPLPEAKQLLPDGIGGLLIVARYQATPGPNSTAETRITRLDAEANRTDRLVAEGTRIELVGQAGRAYLHTKQSDTISISKEVIDVVSGAVLWNLPVDWHWIAARPDGGAAADRNGEIGHFDSTGQLVTSGMLNLTSPVQQSESWTGNAASGLTAFAAAFDDATRFSATYLKLGFASEEPTGFGNRQAASGIRRPGVGLFLKSHWAIEGLPGYHHLSIRIVPRNQGYWIPQIPSDSPTDVYGNRYLTIGAGPPGSDTGLCSGNLVKGQNRQRDVNEARSSPLTELSRASVTPGGLIYLRSEDAMIQSIRNAYDNYDDDVPYACFPEDNPGYYNSNSFVSGLLDAAQITKPSISVLAPGWVTPVPVLKFQ